MGSKTATVGLMALMLIAHLECSMAKTIAVNWVIPPQISGAAWDASTKTLTACKGDKLKVSWSGMIHNLASTSATKWGSCNNAGAKMIVKTGTSGKKLISLSKVGTSYYVCSFSDHCAEGQKMKVVVNAC